MGLTAPAVEGMKVRLPGLRDERVPQNAEPFSGKAAAQIGSDNRANCPNNDRPRSGRIPD
jgi:hypothetical protein